MGPAAGSDIRGPAAVSAFALSLLVYVLLFNGLRPLWGPDEGRYVTGALEMLRRHDFIGIWLNDDTPHFTKPQMTYWTIAAAVAAFGLSEFVVRLPSAIALVATTLLLLPAGRLLTPRLPALPALLYATTWLPFIAGHVVTTDALTALFTTLAGVAFLHLQAGIAPRRAAAALWIGFGLAFLTKGPPTLLALPVFIGWLAWRRDSPAMRALWLSPGLPLFFLIGLGWYLVAERRFPGLLHYLLGSEVEDRMASGKFARNSAWYDGVLIYLPTVIIGAMPWLPAWLWLRRRRPVAPALAEPVDRLLLLWIGIPFAVLHLARSRLPLYLLPLAAPFALWTARRLEPVVASMARGRQLAALGAAALVLVVAKVGLAQFSPADRDGRRDAQEIARLEPRPIEDIVFVDERARWELRFYLGAQLHQAWARRTPYEPAYRVAPTLEELLARHAKAGRRVFVVHPKSVAEFEQVVRAAALCPEALGPAAGNIVYRAGPGACARSSTWEYRWPIAASRRRRRPWPACILACGN
jgi:4-amino-4-deoxy-L-arabinose transferase